MAGSRGRSSAPRSPLRRRPSPGSSSPSSPPSPSSPSPDPPRDPRHALGARAEDLAAAALAARGYVIVDRNYRYRGGELDLVARDGETLVFVEVRGRRTAAFGAPFETVGREKQRRVARAAEHWLVSHGLTRAFARFDVVSVVCAPGQPPAVEVIVNAFEA